ncbi:hypothetical protein BU25DRAFT_413104 [Macroventuria anomochaeta]|uniref:Uncharacterized protein n=1 Tax=Macroventuria anomochaeta TaxID=301207 RepID=A0ACB6RT67_9PLEO|nr:uncharacterized protein BU25DRAFT_413104 [Macroventuria anomochaeta]KAF2624928.1 hypothetical protein BU25DRAFT_413104 [Macroventuria anomochaeta]
MGALLSLPITLLNFLLPFTKPGTPILQDLIHTAILCGTLYYAPQIAEWYNTRQLGNITDGVGQHDGQDQEQDAQQEDPHNARDTPQDPPVQQDRAASQPQIEDGDEAPAPQPGPAAPPQQPEQLVPDEAVAGPANERPRPTPANRAVGAKKAKSLARKDQRRAYHEFHRQEAELRRLQAAEGAEEREAALAAEKARRAAAEAEIVERERREREEVKRERERELQEEQERRERVVQVIKEEVETRGAVDLVDVAWKEGKDQLWVERLVRASGLLAQLLRDGAKMMVTSQGWLVRVDRNLLEQAYKEAEEFGEANEGKVGFEAFGDMLERAVRARAKT